MKKVIVTTLIFIVLGTVWTLFLEHEKRRFVDSLPKPPIMVTQPVTTDAPSASGIGESSATDPPLPGPSAIGEETTGATELTDQGDLQDADVFELTDLSAESFFPERVSESDEEDTAQAPAYLDAPETQERRRHWTELSQEELYQHRRHLMVKKHGDIPEIDVYLRYTIYPKPFLALDESREFVQAILTLFPSENNRRKLEPLLRKWDRKVGQHRSNLPPNFKLIPMER